MSVQIAKDRKFTSIIQAVCIKVAWCLVSSPRPAGFQKIALTSSAIPVNASPMPEGLAPCDILRKLSPVTPAPIAIRFDAASAKKTTNKAIFVLFLFMAAPRPI